MQGTTAILAHLRRPDKPISVRALHSWCKIACLF